MATLTTYATSASGRVESYNTTYSTARTGSNLVASADGNIVYGGGQRLSSVTFYLNQTFLAFDTSDIPAGATVTSATLSLYLSSASQNATTHVDEVYALSWGDTLTTADWVANGAASGSLLASFDTTGAASGAYKDFSSETAFLAAIAKAGTTYLYITGDRLRAGTEPTGGERLSWYLNEANKRPRLVVEYDVATTTFLPHVMCHHFIPQQLGGH